MPMPMPMPGEIVGEVDEGDGRRRRHSDVQRVRRSCSEGRGSSFSGENCEIN